MYMLNVTCMSLCLSVNVLGMELVIDMKENHDKQAWKSNKQSEHTLSHDMQAWKAKQFNDKNGFFSPEILTSIFSYSLIEDEHQLKSLEKSIKNFMDLRPVCKNFKNSLTHKAIGQLCKAYAQQDKNMLLKKVYRIKRRQPYTAVLIHAGADATIENNFLLKKAVLDNNEQFISTLLEHHADAYMTINNAGPIFSHARKIKIAKLFINNHVDIHKTWKSNGSISNVLWHIITDEWFKYPSDLMLFYIEQGVDAKLCNKNGYSLLHAFAASDYRRNTDDFLEKGKILLDALPDMINTLSKNEDTPIDTAQNILKTLKKQSRFEKQCDALTQLIALYKEHGGLSAQELKQKENHYNALKKENCTVQ